MRIERIEQLYIELPFKKPFKTSYGEMTHKLAAIYVLYDESGFYGLGELDALEHPDYIEETFDTSLLITEKYLIPAILHRDFSHPSEISDWFRSIQGYSMAKSALETAIWDLYARKEQKPLRELIGGTSEPIEVGVSVGIIEDLDQLVDEVGRYVQQGYRRVKLKIKPSYDYHPLNRLREVYPDITLMADANSAYQFLDDWSVFKQLDQLGLAMIEQPFHQRDYVKHAKLQSQIRTRICLDENIRSFEDVQTAVTLGSCQAINLKIPRVGGIVEAQRIWQYCKEQDILVWLGGMYEAGVGRALNLQIASLPIFSFPGDLSATDRYFNEDIVTPSLYLLHAKFPLPIAAGIGVELNRPIISHYLKETKFFQ